MLMIYDGDAGDSDGDDAVGAFLKCMSERKEWRRAPGFHNLFGRRPGRMGWLQRARGPNTTLLSPPLAF